MPRDTQTIETEMGAKRAEAAAKIRDGLHLTPEFEAIIARYRVLRQERQAAITISGEDINIETITG